MLVNIKSIIKQDNKFELIVKLGTEKNSDMFMSICYRLRTEGFKFNKHTKLWEKNYTDKEYISDRLQDDITFLKQLGKHYKIVYLKEVNVETSY